MTRLQVELAKEHRKVSKLITKMYGAPICIKVERGVTDTASMILVFVTYTKQVSKMWYIHQNLTTKQLLQYIKHNAPS